MINISIESFKLLLNEINKNKNSNTVIIRDFRSKGTSNKGMTNPYYFSRHIHGNCSLITTEM